MLAAIENSLPALALPFSIIILIGVFTTITGYLWVWPALCRRQDKETTHYRHRRCHYRRYHRILFRLVSWSHLYPHRRHCRCLTAHRHYISDVYGQEDFMMT